MDFDVDLYGECAEVMLAYDEVDIMLQDFLARASVRALSWTSYINTLQAYQSNVQPTDLAAFGLTQTQCDEFCKQAMNPNNWPFLTRESPFEALCPSSSKASLADLEWQCAHSEIIPSERPSFSPRSFGKHRYILHAFAGRRRHGDFQFYLDAIILSQPGVTVHTLSVDIILDRTWGDVANPEVQQFWIHAVQQRWVIGFLGGPPCESWSRAREHALIGESTGPRVVRTASTSWGLPSLAL